MNIRWPGLAIQVRFGTYELVFGFGKEDEEPELECSAVGSETERFGFQADTEEISGKRSLARTTTRKA